MTFIKDAFFTQPAINLGTPSKVDVFFLCSNIVQVISLHTKGLRSEYAKTMHAVNNVMKRMSFAYSVYSTYKLTRHIYKKYIFFTNEPLSGMDMFVFSVAAVASYCFWRRIKSIAMTIFNSGSMCSFMLYTQLRCFQKGKEYFFSRVQLTGKESRCVTHIFLNCLAVSHTNFAFLSINTLCTLYRLLKHSQPVVREVAQEKWDVLGSSQQDDIRAVWGRIASKQIESDIIAKIITLFQGTTEKQRNYIFRTIDLIPREERSYAVIKAIVDLFTTMKHQWNAFDMICKIPEKERVRMIESSENLLIRIGNQLKYITDKHMQVTIFTEFCCMPQDSLLRIMNQLEKITNKETRIFILIVIWFMPRNKKPGEVIQAIIDLFKNITSNKELNEVVSGITRISRRKRADVILQVIDRFKEVSDGYWRSFILKVIAIIPEKDRKVEVMMDIVDLFQDIDDRDLQLSILDILYYCVAPELRVDVINEIKDRKEILEDRDNILLRLFENKEIREGSWQYLEKSLNEMMGPEKKQQLLTYLLQNADILFIDENHFLFPMA